MALFLVKQELIASRGAVQTCKVASLADASALDCSPSHNLHFRKGQDLCQTSINYEKVYAKGICIAHPLKSVISRIKCCLAFKSTVLP